LRKQECPIFLRVSSFELRENPIPFIPVETDLGQGNKKAHCQRGAVVAKNGSRIWYMLRAIDKWLVGYLRSVAARPRRIEGPRHLLFCLVDHFEPFRDDVSVESARELVARWRDDSPRLFDSIRDADGRSPRHTFFYPEEEYDEKSLAWLADLCSRGYGEVEIHIHHRNDTKDGLREKLSGFRDILRQHHGFLGTDPTAGIRYGFIHGNWALCNSRPDGDWCGVNEELGVLVETGCYADFTFPSAPSPTQPRVVNQVYYARDRPGRPRGYDVGESVSVELAYDGGEGKGMTTKHPNGGESGGPLLMVQGPLALDWARRKFGVLPRVDNGEISGVNPPTHARAALWARQHIHVQGRPDWIIVKAHTHGCVPRNMAVLLGDRMRDFHKSLNRLFNDGETWQLHYVTAREVFNIVKAAEAGYSGSPDNYRDFIVKPPPITPTIP